MRQPTKADLLDEIRRLKAENERLTRLVETQRPELDSLRQLYRHVRDLHRDVPYQLDQAVKMAEAILPANRDDLPSVSEMCGIASKGRKRVNAALENK